MFYSRIYYRDELMDSSRAQSEVILSSILTPEQLRVQSLWHQCEVKIDSRTFLQIWKLTELGVPHHNIANLLNDIARYNKKKTQRS